MSLEGKLAIVMLISLIVSGGVLLWNSAEVKAQKEGKIGAYPLSDDAETFWCYGFTVPLLFFIWDVIIRVLIWFITA